MNLFNLAIIAMVLGLGTVCAAALFHEQINRGLGALQAWRAQRAEAKRKAEDELFMWLYYYNERRRREAQAKPAPAAPFTIPHCLRDFKGSHR